MGDDRPNLKLSAEDGEETRIALARYRDGHGLDSLEEGIRDLLPDWTFNSTVSPEVGAMFEGSKHYSLVDPKKSDSPTISGFRDDDSRQLFVGGSSSSSWEKQIGYVRGLIQDIKQTAERMDYELSELSIYDIGTVDEFVDAGFGRDGDRDLEELGDYCEGRAVHIGDLSVSGVSGAATLAEALETVSENQLIALLPKESPITAVSEPSVPSTLHFQENISQ
jgi:hypothetical protein